MAPPPYASSSPQLGHDLFLHAQAYGALPLAIQWFLNGQPIANGTNADLVLMNFSTNQNGSYTYTASNSFAVVTSPGLFLNAAIEGPSLYPFSSSRDVFVDQPVVIQATPVGAPPPQLQWQRNGTNLPGATNFSLLFTNVTMADHGFYVLNASNPFSSATIGIAVNVQPRRALDRWTWRNPRPQANDLRHVATGQGRIVAGGEGGSLVTSTNGIDWVNIALGDQFRVESVVFGNGLFVALASGEQDPDLLFVSTNGVDWQPRSPPLLDAYTLDFVNGEFFLIGYAGLGPTRLARSTDAQTWSPHLIPTFQAGNIIGMAHGNGLYVLASPVEILVSPDAVHWQRHYASLFPNRLTFGNGVFAISTYGGEVWTSTDGRVWYARQTSLFPSASSSATLESIATGQGQFIAVGVNGAIVRSANGQTWTTANATTTRNLRDVKFTGSQWIVCGKDGVLLTSPNGVTWTDQRAGRTRDLYGIIYTNGQFVAVGYEGTVLTSPDALTWTTRVSNTSRDLHAITYAAGLYVAGGRNGTVITSPNTINWTVRATPTTNYIERIAWGTGRFVAAATHGTILSSTNGFTWQQHPHPAPADTEFEGVAYGGGRFVMVGVNTDSRAHSVMLWSSNGVDWADSSVDVGKGLRGVDYDGGQFLAVGNDGVTLFSSSGLTWEAPQYVTPFRNWRHVRHALGHFIVLGNEGSLVSRRSLGGMGWNPHTTIVSQNLHDIAYGAGKFVAVGNAGTIVQSEFAVPHFSTPVHTNGVTSFRITGGLEDEYRVESSLFFNFWQPAGTYTNDGHGATFTNAGNFSQSFYRAVSP